MQRVKDLLGGLLRKIRKVASGACSRGGGDASPARPPARHWDATPTRPGRGPPKRGPSSRGRGRGPPAVAATPANGIRDLLQNLGQGSAGAKCCCLSAEVLQIIFLNLDTRTVVAVAALVCKRWQLACRQMTMPAFDLAWAPGLRRRSVATRTKAVVSLLARVGGARAVDLTGHPRRGADADPRGRARDALLALPNTAGNVADAAVAAVGTLRHVQVLNLANGPRSVQTDAGLKHMAASLRTSLVSLDLTLCDRLTDQSLLYIAQLRELTDLSLNKCQGLTGPGLRHLASLPKLATLDLGRGIGDHADFISRQRHVIHDHDPVPISRITTLFSLRLGGTAITDAGLAMLSCDLPALKTLHVESCQRITDEGLQHLAGLTTIGLGLCTGITDRGVRFLAEVACVNLDGCTGVTPKGKALRARRSTVHEHFLRLDADTAA